MNCNVITKKMSFDMFNNASEKKNLIVNGIVLTDKLCKKASVDIYRNIVRERKKLEASFSKELTFKQSC